MDFLNSPQAQAILPSFLLLVVLTAGIAAIDAWKWFKSRQRGKDNTAP